MPAAAHQAADARADPGEFALLKLAPNHHVILDLEYRHALLRHLSSILAAGSFVSLYRLAGLHETDDRRHHNLLEIQSHLFVISNCIQQDIYDTICTKSCCYSTLSMNVSHNPTRSRRKGEFYALPVADSAFAPIRRDRLRAIRHRHPHPDPDPTTNPDKAPCGLPPQGTIVASDEYTLNANCMQTGTLEIKTANTSNITLTINGGGHTISVGKDKRMNFLIVDDQGYLTLFDADVTASPNVKVIINNVTFDGNGRSFTSHRYQGGGEHCSGSDPCWTFYGAGISAEGTLEMENVTFTGGNGSWLRVEGTATLENVLFEDNWISSVGFSKYSRGVLHVSKTGSVTLDKAVFRDTARVVIAIEKGGSLSTAGCLSFIRVWSHKAHHSGVWGGFGAWSGKSIPPCPSGKIGNNGQAVVAYTLPTLPCGLPSGGTIEGEVDYTLTQPCVCVSTVNIAAGASVTINANGNRIQGCTSGAGYGRFNIGNARLTINNAILYNTRVYTYGGQYTLADSSVLNAVKVPIVNYGWALSVEFAFREQ